MTEQSTRLRYLRRKDYRPAIHHPDYFVTARLQHFMEASIARHIGPGMRVADVGCGEQPWRQSVQAAGGGYVGLDVQQNQAGTVALIASATALPVADAQFDVVILTEVLEHVLHTEKAAAEAVRILKPGGRLLVSTPFAYPLHEEPYDYIRLTPYYLQDLARRLGMSTLLLDRTGNALEVVATAACHIWLDVFAATGESSPPFLGRVVRAAMTAAVNSVTRVIGAVLGRRLSKRYYLNLVAVLIKDAARGAGPA